MSEPRNDAERALNIGWIVDVQHDFMEPEGRLYVRHLSEPGDPGARLVRQQIIEVAQWMHSVCDVIVYTGDWHGHDDDEIDLVQPDALKGTYPPHCMGRSSDALERAGAEIIAEIRPEAPLVLEVDAAAGQGRAVADAALQSGRPIFIQKNRFDVFAGNPETESLVAALAAASARPLHITVCGVARDVCVTQAVDGLQAREHHVTALSDATWGLGLEPEEVTLARWARRGRVLTFDELRRGR